MTLEQLREQITSILQLDDCAATFHFLLQTSDGLKFKVFDLEEDSQNDLFDTFKTSLTRLISQDEITLLDLTLADNRANAIYRYDIATPPEFTKILSTSITAILEKFDPEHDSLNDICAIIINIGTAESHLTLYKHQYPVSIFKQEGLFARIRGRDRTTFSQFNGDLIRINSTFEFVFMSGQIFVCDLKTLERYYGFHEAIKNVAIQGIEKINTKDLLESTLPLSSRLDETSFAKKVARIAVDSYVLNRIPNDIIIAFTKSHPLLNKKFSYTPTNDKIVLKTKVSQDLFVKLLNDDFLRSDLTQRYYESLAKDRIESLV